MSYTVIEHPDLPQPIVELSADHLMERQPVGFAERLASAKEAFGGFVGRVRTLGRVALGGQDERWITDHKTYLAPEESPAPAVAEVAEVKSVAEKHGFMSRVRDLGNRVVRSYQEHRADIKRDDGAGFVFEGLSTQGVDRAYAPLREQASVVVEPGRKWATVYGSGSEPVSVPTVEAHAAHVPDDRDYRVRNLAQYVEAGSRTAYISRNVSGTSSRPKDLADVLAAEANEAKMSTRPRDLGEYEARLHASRQENRAPGTVRANARVIPFRRTSALYVAAGTYEPRHLRNAA